MIWLLFGVGGIVVGEGMVVVALMFAADAENHAEAVELAAELERRAAP